MINQRHNKKLKNKNYEEGIKVLFLSLKMSIVINYHSAVRQNAGVRFLSQRAINSRTGRNNNVFIDYVQELSIKNISEIMECLGDDPRIEINCPSLEKQDICARYISLKRIVCRLDRRTNIFIDDIRKASKETVSELVSQLAKENVTINFNIIEKYDEDYFRTIRLQNAGLF